MRVMPIGKLRYLATTRSSTEVKAFQFRSTFLHPIPCRRLSPLTKIRHLSERNRSRQCLRLSASATAANPSAFSSLPVRERMPLGMDMPEDFQKIQTLTTADLKKNGRIIIVGDVHGCYAEFCSLLEACDYKPNEDNLIMAGDLVNKGPDSIKVLKKAMKLKAHVVRGNHEDNALDAYYDYMSGREIAEKYQWVTDLKKKHITFLENLPFAIRIPSHKIIVVHAGLVPGIEVEKQDMFSMYRMRELRRCEIRNSWIPLERGIEESIPWASQWQGPEHVIFGHDSSRRLQYHSFATGLDTGAVQGDHLSACIVPPAKRIPNPNGPASRENLGMQLVSIDVDGPKKVMFPKSTEELSKILTHIVTATDNQWLDMYSSFEEQAPESVA